MTIVEIVEKHGLPVKVQACGSRRSWEPFIVTNKRPGGWYVEYDHKDGTYFIADNPNLDDYERVDMISKQRTV